MTKVVVDISRITGLVQNANCMCPAVKSGYCTHVMALLFELVDFSKRGLQNMLDEKACTSTTKAVGNPW